MTDRETVRALCKIILTRLENNKAISFAPRLRQQIWEQVYDLVGRDILTDQDIRDRAIEKMHVGGELLNDTAFTESEQFKAAKRSVRAEVGEHELNGLYFQKPMRHIAEAMVAFLMSAPDIEDVFESDEDLNRLIVEVIRKFNPRELH